MAEPGSNGRSLVARRFALRIQPIPSIVLEYEDHGKTRLRTVKLDKERLQTTTIEELTAKVLKK